MNLHTFENHWKNWVLRLMQEGMGSPHLWTKELLPPILFRLKCRHSNMDWCWLQFLTSSSNRLFLFCSLLGIGHVHTFAFQNAGRVRPDTFDSVLSTRFFSFFGFICVFSLIQSFKPFSAFLPACGFLRVCNEIMSWRLSYRFALDFLDWVMEFPGGPCYFYFASELVFS